MALGEIDSLEPERTPVPPEGSSQDSCLFPGHNEPGISWEQLLRQARAGSPAAVGRLLDQCRGYLTVIVQQEIGDQIRAKVAPSDVVQESLVEAYRNFGQFDGANEKELLRWLRRTVLNNLIDAAKKYRGTARRNVDRERSLTRNANDDEPIPELFANSSLPLEKVIRIEEQQRLLTAIGQLPERQRQAVILRNLESKSFQEIGSALQISSDAARKLWERAIDRLSKELGSDGRRSATT
jgi:RNA polymerase sigma-70 factor (ECF subfamily)